jgi:ribonuclease Z
VTDAIYSRDNVNKILDLIRFSDMVFIEAPFLDSDREKAAETYHLTAKQAGLLAREAGAKRLSVFHFSPKYRGRGDVLTREAMAAFRGG